MLPNFFREMQQIQTAIQMIMRLNPNFQEILSQKVKQPIKNILANYSAKNAYLNSLYMGF